MIVFLLQLLSLCSLFLFCFPPLFPPLAPRFVFSADRTTCENPAWMHFSGLAVRAVEGGLVFLVFLSAVLVCSAVLWATRVAPVVTPVGVRLVRAMEAAAEDVTAVSPRTASAGDAGGISVGAAHLAESSWLVLFSFCAG